VSPDAGSSDAGQLLLFAACAGATVRAHGQEFTHASIDCVIIEFNLLSERRFSSILSMECCTVRMMTLERELAGEGLKGIRVGRVGGTDRAHP